MGRVRAKRLEAEKSNRILAGENGKADQMPQDMRYKGRKSKDGRGVIYYEYAGDAASVIDALSAGGFSVESVSVEYPNKSGGKSRKDIPARSVAAAQSRLGNRGTWSVKARGAAGAYSVRIDPQTRELAVGVSKNTLRCILAFTDAVGAEFPEAARTRGAGKAGAKSAVAAKAAAGAAAGAGTAAAASSAAQPFSAPTGKQGAQHEPTMPQDASPFAVAPRQHDGTTFQTFGASEPSFDNGALFDGSTATPTRDAPRQDAYPMPYQDAPYQQRRAVPQQQQPFMQEQPAPAETGAATGADASDGELALETFDEKSQKRIKAKHVPMYLAAIVEVTLIGSVIFGIMSLVQLIGAAMAKKKGHYAKALDKVMFARTLLIMGVPFALLWWGVLFAIVWFAFH